MLESMSYISYIYIYISAYLTPGSPTLATEERLQFYYFAVTHAEKIS